MRLRQLDDSVKLGWTKVCTGVHRTGGSAVRGRDGFQSGNGLETARAEAGGGFDGR